MNFLNFGLAAIVSYLGLIAGLIIMKASIEEQKAGKKYFIFFRKILLLLIIIFILYYLRLDIIILVLIALIFIITLIKVEESYFIYPLLGIMLFLSSVNLNLLLIESFLIFSYGLVSASLLFNKKNYVEIAFKHVSFLIVAILLFSFSAMF